MCRPVWSNGSGPRNLVPRKPNPAGVLGDGWWPTFSSFRAPLIRGGPVWRLWWPLDVFAAPRFLRWKLARLPAEVYYSPCQPASHPRYLPQLPSRSDIYRRLLDGSARSTTESTTPPTTADTPEMSESAVWLRSVTCFV
jgi:hypothetical protein